MDQDIKYWMQDKGIQNFGDFLSEYFLQHLFFVQPQTGEEIRIVGSCLDDMFVTVADPGTLHAGRPQVFWGCGLREAGGLSTERQDLVEILAVRGPLTRSELRLGNGVPIGDPGLLLPALYKTARLARPTSTALLIPHFHESRTDAELLALTGCDEVLRPNIRNDLTAVEDFIDRVVRADFVLAGALHGAIAAAAYERKFAFWDSGSIDLPFKWNDFAASLNIPCVFHTLVEAARAHYDIEIAPALRLPVLWPLLVAAPLPVRPDAFLSVLDIDIRRHGLAALDASVSSRAANKLQLKLQDLVSKAQSVAGLQAALAAGQASEVALRDQASDLRDQVTRLAATETRLADELLSTRSSAEQAQSAAIAAQQALAQSEYEAERRIRALQARMAELTTEVERTHNLETQIQAMHAHIEQASEIEKKRRRRRAEAPLDDADRDAELARLRAREAWLAAEEARLHEAVYHRDHALEATRDALRQQHEQYAAVLGSVSWRVAAPMRSMARRSLWLRRRFARPLRLLWWTISLQLPRRLQERRRVFQEISTLAASPLFDATYYLQQCPQAAAAISPAAHYVLSGAAAGFEPNRLFDGAWYKRTYADSAAARRSALWHFVTRGAAAGYDPHPLFDSLWYQQQNPGAGTGTGPLEHHLATDAAPNRLFDRAGYLAEYRNARESGLGAIQHYLLHGAASGNDPHPLFDTKWYLETYPEVQGSGLNPLAYYLRHGAAAGHDCTPLARDLAGFNIAEPLALPIFAEPEASIVIPAYGHLFDTVRCLHAIMRHSGSRVGFETIIADDNPDNPIAPYLEGTPGLRIERNPDNLGFLRTCNRAGALARGWHIVFLNNDTLVRPDWLAPLVELVRDDPGVGIVGCKLLNRDDTVQEAGGIIFDDGWGFPFGRGDDSAKSAYNYRRDVDVVTGAAFLVRRDLFQALRGFDDRYAPAFYEEFDLAFEARRAGYKVVYQPRSEVVHLGSASYGAEMRDRQSLRNHAQFCLKWEDVLDKQPSRDADLFLARQRPATGGTVLMIDDKIPEFDRHAGALTIFQYIGLLGDLGLRVVFAPADGAVRQPYQTRLQDMGVEVITGPAGLADWLAHNGSHLLAIWTARPDVTAPLLSMLRRATDAKILYYPHDLHYLREFRRFELEGNLDALAESHRVRQLEMRIFAEVDCVMTPSAEEAEVIAGRVPAAIIRVIPPYIYQAGVTAAIPADAFVERQTVLFVGGFKHPPNVDSALWLAGEIMPLVWQRMPHALLVIVGDEPTEAVKALAGERVEVTGFVPTLDPYFARARLTVAPLRYGAGVKGKIVSSLQAGVPVVTTKVGNEGIALVDGREVLLAETPAEIASHICHLLEDTELCAALSAAGARVIGTRFSAHSARQTMQDIMGIDHCQLCGTTRLTVSDNEVLQGTGTSGPDECIVCSATNRTEALVDVLLTVLPGRRVADLYAAVPHLSRLRIHAFDASDALLDVLGRCPLFTGPGIEAPFRGGECDLTIDERSSNAPLDASALQRAYGALKPGGRHLLSVDSASATNDGLGAMLTQTGFHVTEHAFIQTEGITGRPTIFDLLRA